MVVANRYQASTIHLALIVKVCISLIRLYRILDAIKLVLLRVNNFYLKLSV